MSSDQTKPENDQRHSENVEPWMLDVASGILCDLGGPGITDDKQMLIATRIARAVREAKAEAYENAAIAIRVARGEVVPRNAAGLGDSKRARRAYESAFDLCERRVRALAAADATPRSAPPPVASHPMQPLIIDAQGVVRYKANAIVKRLVDTGAIDLNRIVTWDVPDEDIEQFWMLMGYSAAGMEELSFIRDETVNRIRAMRGLAPLATSEDVDDDERDG